MSTNPDTPRLRRIVGGLSMLLAPALLAVGELLHPRFETSAPALIAAVRDAPGRQYAAHAVFFVSLALFVPAILGAVRLLELRRTAWGHVGGSLAVLGALALAVFLGAEFVLWQAVKAPETDLGAMTALFDRLNESPGFVPFYLIALGFPAGWLVLALGLRLAGAIALWQAALIGLAPVIAFGLELSGGPKVVVVAGAVAFWVGLASLGRRLLDEAERGPARADELHPAASR